MREGPPWNGSELAGHQMVSTVLGQNYVEQLIQAYLGQLTTPAGMAAILAGVLLAIVLLSVDRAKWAALSAAIYLSTYAVARVGENSPPLPQPFATVGNLGQGITFGMVFLLAVAAVRPTEWRRRHLILPAAVALLVFQFIFATRMIASEYFVKGVLAGFMYSVMFGVMGLGLSRWLYDENHALKLFKTVSWAGGTMVAASLILLAVSYNAAFLGGRFMGTTNNPQRIGAMLALTLPFSLGVIGTRGAGVTVRVTHAAIVACVILAVFATGSRTGGLLSLVAVAFFFRSRLGTATLVAILVGTFALAGYMLFGDVVESGADRLASFEDTRSAAWRYCWNLFLASPLVGTPMDSAAGETSYLSAAAVMGIGGLISILVLAGLLVFTAVRLAGRRRSAGPYRSTIDVVVASLAQVVISWVFEAFAFGTVTDHVLVLYCSLALASLATERTDPSALAAAGPPDGWAEGQDDEAGDDAHGYYPTPA